MHEKDHLDRMLESSLSSYGDPGVDSGLTERVLARVSREQELSQSAPGWRRRLVLWAALPAAACLLLTFLLLRSAGPGATHQSASLPLPASTSTGSKAPKVANGALARKTSVAAKPHAQTPAATAVAKSAARPKLDVFPLPRPLSPEERALYAFATQVPAEQRQAVLAAQKNDDAPLNVAALHIQPIEISDTGKN